VDPPDEETGFRLETFDANERFVVVRDDEGYGVWRLDDLEDGEPIERFTDDDEGYEAAARRWKELTREVRDPMRWLDRLRIAILGGLALWVVTSAIPSVELLFEERGGPFGAGPEESGFDRIVYAISAISFDAWIAGAIAYVILWMDARRRGERSVPPA
jgi:hypothetical protein